MAAKLSRGVFNQLGVAEFLSLLAAFTPVRRITAVHLHHTWKPRHKDYRGAETMRGMWRFHTETQHWQDIAQHLTIAPDGTVWTGRHWDLPPASAAGHNGSSHAGPFMIEMIGNFDTGEDPFDGEQKATAVTVLAALLDRFDLPAEAIHFHNEISAKSCPGSSIERGALLKAVTDRRRRLGEPRAVDAVPSPFDAEADTLFQALAFLRSTDASDRPVHPDDRWDAEPLEDEQQDAALRQAAVMLDAAATARDDVPAQFTPEIKEALRPYLVNLTRGRLSTTGEFTTSLFDVELMFSTHLPKALAAATAAGRPLPVVVYAHGGLNDERDGLAVAAKHVHWWVRNGAYPIYFAWETGLLSSLVHVIRGALGGARAAARPDVLDFTDAQIEAAARRFGANRFWADMKHIAELALEPGGGARLVAEKLGAFAAANREHLEVHAVGHSAGSNFHSVFLPHLLDAGVAQVKTVQLLAPAISVDRFLDTIMRRLRSIGALTMFTMNDNFERADQTGGVYRKSLLYLIHEALEDREEVPLLGLEKSVLDDIRLTRLFGIGGRVTDRTDTVIWSPSGEEDLAAASKSVSHGGFDDDPSTMNSVLRRVLGLRGTDPVPDPFVAPAVRRDVDGPPIDASPSMPVTARPAPVPVAVAADEQRGSRGRRRALCVGINAYRRNRLNGCVADARRWASTLEALAFEPPLVLIDGQATRERILRELEQLIGSSRPGDVLVFQFAGHGTTVPDRNGDELGGDSPVDDEALCPIDFDDGRLIIDDDLAAVLHTIPAGVRLTSFIDACHSGTVSRLGLGGQPGRTDGDEHPRFVVADQALIDAHFAFRSGNNEPRTAASRQSAAERDVLFSACRSTEVAWESNGQGDFTRHATQVLARGGSAITHFEFLAQVQAAFGARARQHPEVYPTSAGSMKLFSPTPNRGTDLASAAPVLESIGSAGQPQAVAALLRSIAALLVAER